uniref:Uncharacterized protein n=1 Tax=Alexandrium andersonii TaxID=327968 RepID=A0A7S2IYL3_9DINO
MIAISFAVFSQVTYSAGLRMMAVPPNFAASLNSLCIFLLAFFVGQNFSEANARFENVCKTNGCVTRLSAIAGGLLPYKYAHLLMRHTNAIMHIYYLMLSGPMDDAKWSLLEERGLLSREEISSLQLQGSPAVVLYSWAIKALRVVPTEDGCKAGPELPERLFLQLLQPLEEQIGGARGLAAKQVAYTITQIPSVYFHIVYVAVNMFLLCTTYEMGHAVALAWNKTCDDIMEEGAVCVPKVAMSVVLQVVTVGLFLGLLLTAEGMSDIYGNKVFDYDLGVDLDSLWNESQNVLKSMAHDPPCLAHQPQPLPEPKADPAPKGRSQV